MKTDIIKDKSFFLLLILSICTYLAGNKKEYVMLRQLLKMETSIGANIREAQFDQSRADFTHKMSISLK